MSTRKRPDGEFGSGPLADYYTLPGWDRYEDRCGPMYETRDGVQPKRCAMLLEPHHCNTFGIVHGGLLMTFADYAIFAVARSDIGPGGGVTVSMTSDFVAAAREGELLEASVEVTKATRSMVFVRGREYVGENTVLSFSAIIKKLRA